MPRWNESRLRTAYERLIVRSLPGVPTGKIRVNTEGWQNVVFEVGDQFIFRFPRTARNARELAIETRLLERLAPVLPLSVPDPIVVGRIPETKGWPFMGYRRIPGQPEDWDRVSPVLRHKIAEDLAPLLQKLARFPTSLALRLGVRGGGPSKWKSLHEQELRRVRRLAFPVMREPLRRSVLDAFRAYLDDPKNFMWRPCLVHTEIHGGHVLMRQRRVSGVIDWGYAAVGDPARELAAWASHFGTQDLSTLARGRMTSRDETFLARVALYRTLVPVYHIVGGVQSGNEQMVRSGLRYLRRALRTPLDRGWT